MKSDAKQIFDLIQSEGKSAAKMTKGLKLIGDGDMEAGLYKLAEYMKKEGEKKGIIEGSIGTATILLIGGAIVYLIYDMIKKNRALNEEGKAILRDLEEGLSYDEDE